MAKKTGRCVNIDCDNYKQEVEVAAGEEFICPVCGKPLEEANGGSKGSKKGGNGGGNKKIAIIAAAAVVVLGGGAGLYFCLSGDGDKTEQPPVETPVDSLETTGDTLVTDSPVVEGPETKKPNTVTEPEKTNEPQPVKPITPAPKSGHGTVNLGYGTYTGDLKNGQPHGHGTITYTQSHKIVNSKDFVANPGDTFEGDFRDGRISSIGYWTHDGNQTAVKP